MPSALPGCPPPARTVLAGTAWVRRRSEPVVGNVLRRRVLRLGRSFLPFLLEFGSALAGARPPDGVDGEPGQFDRHLGPTRLVGIPPTLLRFLVLSHRDTSGAPTSSAFSFASSWPARCRPSNRTSRFGAGRGRRCAGSGR